MKLSISNIAWPEEWDQQVYDRMRDMGFSGLEIAPTRVFPEQPYEQMEAEQWALQLRVKEGLAVSSMQSIWYGRNERIFLGDKERSFLEEYTCKAIDFAASIGCGNLVFGCPKNRYLPEGVAAESADAFFGRLGRYAKERECVIAIEANPVIYHTNFLNTTQEAIYFIKRMENPGILLNLDLGTMVENGESVRELRGAEKWIHHVHISEPGLEVLQKRKIHEELADFLNSTGYKGYVSIEVKRQDKMDTLWYMMDYVKDIFG